MLAFSHKLIQYNRVPSRNSIQDIGFVPERTHFTLHMRPLRDSEKAPIYGKAFKKWLCWIPAQFTMLTAGSSLGWHPYKSLVLSNAVMGAYTVGCNGGVKAFLKALTGSVLSIMACGCIEFGLGIKGVDSLIQSARVNSQRSVTNLGAATRIFISIFFHNLAIEGFSNFFENFGKFITTCILPAILLHQLFTREEFLVYDSISLVVLHLVFKLSILKDLDLIQLPATPLYLFGLASLIFSFILEIPFFKLTASTVLNIKILSLAVWNSISYFPQAYLLAKRDYLIEQEQKNFEPTLHAILRLIAEHFQAN